MTEAEERALRRERIRKIVAELFVVRADVPGQGLGDGEVQGRPRRGPGHVQRDAVGPHGGPSFSRTAPIIPNGAISFSGPDSGTITPRSTGSPWRKGAEG